MQQRRVVVTGMGAVTPIGNNVPEFWEGIKAGRSGAGPITKFDVSQFKTRFACEVKNFKPEETIEKRDIKRLEPFGQYAAVAAVEAMKDAHLHANDIEPSRLGVITGVGIGGFKTLEDALELIFLDMSYRPPPLTIPKLISNIAPAHIAIQYQACGPVFSMATACASGTDAIGVAYRSIMANETDAIITGGVEACISRVSIVGFNALKALSVKYNDNPLIASRPFDKDRDGFVIGEGAGILVLEEMEHAKGRGAKMYAEVIGSSMTCDAFHVTAPHSEGRGAIDAMNNAIRQAGLQPDDIDYINAHGTSTPLNDLIETKAIKQVFKKHAYKCKISSTKSMHGHTIGAAGGIEAIVCIMAMRDRYFPPTINLDVPDPECDLDYVPHKGQYGKIDITMSNSFGFGGHNGVLILRRI